VAAARTVAATYYRTALLLGLIRGDVVHEWAEDVITNDAQPPSPFIEIVSVPVDDLSEMRHALWPLVIDPPPIDVLRAILGLVHADLASGRRDLADTLTILRQMRSMLKLPASLYADLNQVLVSHDVEAVAGAVEGWLEQFEPDLQAMVSK
jgi:hypothetical protein